MRSTVLTVKVSDVLHDRLDKLAAQRRTTRSEVVRGLLERGIEMASDAPAGTFGALARDLIGCVDGPPDLATDPEHMEGYGR